MEQYLTINKLSKLLGVMPKTLRNWDKGGKLKPHHISFNGYRYYSKEDLDKLQGKRADKAKKMIKELAGNDKNIQD